MGGYGSGRPRKTVKIDKGLKLDLNKLRRDGMVALNSHHFGNWRWTLVSTGEEISSIRYEVNTLNPNDMWMRTCYTCQSYYDDEAKMDYKIKLETTQPNYGGKRFWFVCPLMQRRAAVLYMPQGSKWFASRHAFNLKYHSQSRCAHERAIDRMCKLKNKLGGDEYLRKPKGMHWKTFKRIVDEIHDAEDAFDAYWMEFVINKLGDFEGIL